MKLISSLFLAIVLSLNVFSSLAAESKLYCMKGFVNKSPATMFFAYLSNEQIVSFFGSYYYDAIMLPIDLVGTKKDGVLTLHGLYGSHEEKFEGKLSSTGYNGYWTSGDKKYSFNFTIDKELQSSFSWLFFEHLKYLKKQGEYPLSSYYEAVAFPKENIKNYNSIRREIFEATSEAEMLKKITKPESAFKDEYETLEMEEGNEFMLSNELFSYIIPIFMNKDFIVFEAFTYMYLGGAHGNSGVKYFTYDINKNKLVKISDILINTKSIELKKIIYNHYLIKYGADAGKNLFEDKKALDVPDVFYITPNNITFSYGEYEIASYADGIISVTVPLEKIKKFLTEYAIKTFIK